MDRKYAIGIDYGTESGRVLLVDVDNGEIAAVHVTEYPHGVIDERLPGTDIRLKPDWALQHPRDYLEVLRRSIPYVLKQSGVRPGQVIGVGIDFTACTMLPVNRAGVPLCFDEAYLEEPHAYAKLWKHHAAQGEADRINATAARMSENFVQRYGGKTSSEWMIAKVWQTLNEAPYIYDAAERFLEAADWVTEQLTGNQARSGCCAGYKSFWHKTDGYPPDSFFRELDPRLESLACSKLRGNVLSLGEKAGELTAEAAEMTGLRPGTAVAVSLIDAHAGVSGAGAVKSGQMVMAMGTSLCHMLLHDKEVHVAGICGVVEDGIVPGLYGYEAGQPAVGDMFGWFVERAVSSETEIAAKQAGLSVHEWLESQAAKLRPGQHGLLALDWWNGNRSILVDTDLSGVIVGLTLGTTPEEMYRSLLEAAAFGTRKIIETVEQAGVEVNELFAGGGLPLQNRLLMQIYADVTRREIIIPASTQTSALGAAIFGAIAAGPERGGHGSVEEAARRMVWPAAHTYKPDARKTAIYDRLYKQYNQLHDLFGHSETSVMKELKRIKDDSTEQETK